MANQKTNTANTYVQFYLPTMVLFLTPDLFSLDHSWDHFLHHSWDHSDDSLHHLHTSFAEEGLSTCEKTAIGLGVGAGIVLMGGGCFVGTKYFKKRRLRKRDDYGGAESDMDSLF